MTGNAWVREGREDLIRRLALAGLGNAEIARRLGVKPNTVAYVRKRLGLSMPPRPVAAKADPTTCEICRPLVGMLSVRRSDLRKLAVRASRVKYGPTETLKASIARLKADIVETERLIESHNCGA